MTPRYMVTLSFEGQNQVSTEAWVSPKESEMAGSSHIPHPYLMGHVT